MVATGTTNTTEKNLIEEFNSFFKGRARIAIYGDELKITIGSQTLTVSVPQVIGTESMGRS